MPYAKRADLSLFYEQAGAGEPHLVFIHGWCCDHTFFRPQFEHFQATHGTTTLDLRGCGESSGPPDGYDVPTLADNVGWLCEELGIARPVLVGHSLGAVLAVDLAARRPPAVEAIVAVDPGPLNPAPESLGLLAGLAAALEGPDGDAARRAYVESLFLPTDDAERKRSIVETMSSVPADVAAATLRGFLAWTGVGALALCRVPLLILRSRSGGSNEPARLLPIRADLQFGLTVGAGHFNQLEVPEQVNPMIERFLEIALPART